MKLCTKKTSSVILILMISMCMILASCTNNSVANQDNSTDKSSAVIDAESNMFDTSDDFANDENSDIISEDEKENENTSEESLNESNDGSNEMPSEDESQDVSLDDSQTSSDNSDAGTHEHSFELTNTTITDCNQPARLTYQCKECSATRTEMAENKAGHETGPWTIVTEATTTSKGKESQFCTRCNAVLNSRDIPQLTQECNHFEYIKAVKTDPTCTTKGYTTVSCSCGKTQKINEVPALGHNAGNWVTIKEATTSSTGLKQQSCTRCKKVLKEETIPKVVESNDPFDIIPEKYNVHPKGNQKLVEEAIEYYLNLYREQDGVAKATRLPNKTYEYATRRAVQLSTNFDHDYEDIFKVCNELKFGQYNPPLPEKIIDWDTGKVTYTGAMTPEYYFGGFSEACSGPVTNRQTVDNVARSIAHSIYSSQNHWSYVGASATKYITVGAFDQYDNGGKWWVCIATGDANSKKYDAWDYDDKEYYQE